MQPLYPLKTALNGIIINTLILKQIMISPSFKWITNWKYITMKDKSEVTIRPYSAQEF